MLSILSRAVRLCVLLYAAACASAVAAEAVPPAENSQPLTLREAIERTLARNPRLQGFSYRLQTRDAHVQTAGLRPAPELRAEVENIAGTGAAQGTDLTETTLAISQVIELGDKRIRRIDAARAAGELVEIERQAAQLDVIAEVTRRVIHVVSDQQHLELTHRAEALAERTLEVTKQRVEAARAPEVELNRARIARARAHIEAEHAEHELLTSRVKLAALWGDTEARFGEVRAELQRVPDVPVFETIAKQIDASPDVLRFTSEARVRDAEIRLAEAKARADISVSAGVRRLEASDDEALVFGFTMPLFAKSRASGAIAEAQAQRALTDSEREAQRIQVIAQLFEAYQELKHSITEAESLRDTVAPEMERALKATEYAFERGRYSYLELVEAQRELISVQRSLIEASANSHLLRVEIERLTGSALPATR